MNKKSEPSDTLGFLIEGIIVVGTVGVLLIAILRYGSQVLATFATPEPTPTPKTFITPSSGEASSTPTPPSGELTPTDEETLPTSTPENHLSLEPTAEVTPEP